MKNIDFLVSRIRSSSRTIVRQLGFLNDRFSEIGSISQCHAIVELDSQGVMNVGELSQVLNLDKSSTSRLVTQLYDRGICQMQSDAHDRRNKLVSLTKKGKLLVDKIHSEAKSQVQQALHVLNDEEKDIVVQGLSLYAKALTRARLHKEYKIRKLLKKDVPQLINIIRSVRAEFGFNASHPAIHLFEEELNGIYETYQKDKSHYFVLVDEADTKVVGGAGYSSLSNTRDTCEIKGMYLSPELRGLGLGGLLLEKVLRQAEADGCKRYYLETHNSMANANALYKKFGFKPLSKPLVDTGNDWTNCWYIKEV